MRNPPHVNATVECFVPFDQEPYRTEALNYNKKKTSSKKTPEGYEIRSARSTPLEHAVADLFQKLGFEVAAPQGNLALRKLKGLKFNESDCTATYEDYNLKAINKAYFKAFTSDLCFRNKPTLEVLNPRWYKLEVKEASPDKGKDGSGSWSKLCNYPGLFFMPVAQADIADKIAPDYVLLIPSDWGDRYWTYSTDEVTTKSYSLEKIFAKTVLYDYKKVRDSGILFEPYYDSGNYHAKRSKNVEKDTNNGVFFGEMSIALLKELLNNPVGIEQSAKDKVGYSKPLISSYHGQYEADLAYEKKAKQISDSQIQTYWLLLEQSSNDFKQESWLQYKHSQVRECKEVEIKGWIWQTGIALCELLGSDKFTEELDKRGIPDTVRDLFTFL